MKLWLNLSAAVGLLWLAACVSDPPQPARLAPADLPGPRADGSVLLPNQWSLRPAGKQVPVGDFPIDIALHPAGAFAAVLHSGYSEHEIRIIDLKNAHVVSSAALEEGFYGLLCSPDGKKLFPSGA